MKRHRMVLVAVGLFLAMGLFLGTAPAPGLAADAPTTRPAEAAAPTTRPADAPAMPTVKDKASYIIGMSLGKNFRQAGMDLDLNLLLRGLRDALADKKPALTDEEMKAAMTAFQTEMIGKQTELAKAEAEKNKKDGRAFLDANKKKEGVKTTASGLQYEVLKAGVGATPKAADTVKVNYKGTLLDGTPFDSSEDHGGPATFRADRVITGWVEALQLMKVGDKWKLYVPSDLAYGEVGQGSIGPNAVLIFEVELLDIVADQSLPLPK